MSKNRSITCVVLLIAIVAGPDVYAKEILMYGGSNHDVFLGTLGNKYASNSICNKYGQFGSKYSSDSIWNKYATYGSKYSSDSPWNKYSSNSPVLVDRDGGFYGYFTINKHRSGAVKYAGAMAEIFNQGGHEAVREALCSN